MTTTKDTTHQLTQDDIKQFNADGYCIPSFPLLPDDKFAALSEYFERSLKALPPGERPEAMDKPHFADPTLLQWLGAPEILDMLEPLIGPDIALFTSHFICKMGGDGRRVPWHEDSSYWTTMLDPIEVVTVWLAIDPSNKANGCMKVVPRTHLTPDSDYEEADTNENVFATRIKPSQVDESKALDVCLERGHFSLHDGRLIHGSEPNTGDQRRCGYTMRYISTKTRFNHEKAGDYHGIYLLRGKDHAGNKYLDPNKSYPEFLARSRGKGGH